MAKNKLSKINANIKATKKPINSLKPVAMSPDEREEKIQYLVDLFRLSFRTHESYVDNLLSEEHDLDESYDGAVDFSSSYPSGVNVDDEEIEDFRADFIALDAEDRFTQCCLEYYQDVANELRNSYQKISKQLSSLLTELNELLPLENKKKRWIKNREKPLQERLELTAVYQARIEEKLNALRKSTKPKDLGINKSK